MFRNGGITVRKWIPSIEKVHDAYVIAVEDDARKKLDQFTTDQQVQAVDMTQLPTAAATTSSLNSSNSETSPIKAGPDNSQIKESENQQQQQSEQQENNFKVQDYSQHFPASSFMRQTELSPMPGEKKKSNQQLSSSSEDKNTSDDRWPDSGEWLEMNGVRGKSVSKTGADKSNKTYSNMETPVITSHLHTNGSLTNNKNSNYSGYKNGGHLSHELSQDNSFDYDIDDPGPHNEMAIDVPENFIANIKSSPRYPPPQLTSATPLSLTSSSKTNHKKEKVAKSPMKTSYSATESISKQQQQYHHHPTPQELERLHRHEEELKKRKEEESRLQAEQDFLRISLRGSKKLQALENKRPVGPRVEGFVNTAFDGERDSEDGKNISEAQSSEMTAELYLKKNVGVEDLFSSLHHIRNQLTGSKEQKYISFVKLLYQNEQFQQAVSLHNRLVELTSRSPPVKPITDDTEELCSEIIHNVSQSVHNVHVQELHSLLQKPHFKNLLQAHDTISNQIHKPSDDVEDQGESLDSSLIQYGENGVKIVHLEKTNEHLGATVKNEGESVIIARIVKGGAAEKSGLLHEGDEILEVNGVDMRNRNINDVSEMLANMAGTITFMIIPGNQSSSGSTQRSNKVMHLRALFSYEPEDDLYIPCRELGISFIKGDILHAIALDDPNWWQAFREGEEENQSLAGLIPSKSFTEQRESIKNALENKENKRKSRVCACGRKDRKKKKKSLHTSSSEDVDEILTYEEIARYYPQPNRKRPIVLIGPSNVGRNELQQKLIDSDPDRFSAPIPHTTCPLQGNEVQSGSYHYIPREEFNMMIQQNRFVEFGEHQKHLYGTSFDAVKEVISEGKICLLKIQPETLKVIRVPDIKPYVVFMCPPNLDKLRQIQNQLNNPLVEGVKKGREVLTIDDQLRDIIDRSREMEEVFGHLFDFVLVNSDLSRAYTDLLEEINRIEMEPQWVPASWIGS